MLRTFIFNSLKNNWIEQDDYLFYHDLCAFLDDNSNIIYLWRGPKSSRKQYREGYQSLNELVSRNMQLNLKINVLAKYIPQHIQEKLNQMLLAAKQQMESGKYSFSKFITIRLYLIFLLISIILPIISIILLSSCLFWTQSSDSFLVSPSIYQEWLFYPNILIIISLIAFIVNIVIGSYEKESQVIIFSFMGLIICIGLILYLQQGIYLFLFQEVAGAYLIKIQDVLFFFITVLIVISTFEMPNLLKLVNFIKIYRTYIF